MITTVENSYCTLLLLSWIFKIVWIGDILVRANCMACINATQLACTSLKGCSHTCFFLLLFVTISVGPSNCDSVRNWQGLHYCCCNIYSLTLLVRHSFIRHPRYYNTFLRNQTFLFKTPSFIRLRHSIIRYLELVFCHIKEGMNAKIPFIHVMYI